MGWGLVLEYSIRVRQEPPVGGIVIWGRGSICIRYFCGVVDTAGWGS